MENFNKFIAGEIQNLFDHTVHDTTIKFPKKVYPLYHISAHNKYF